jgi:hypothetical protein
MSNQFWNEAALEPYRGFRWIVTFPGIPHHYHAMKVEKPSFKVGEYIHKFLNHSFFYPGRVEWNAVTMTLVDVPEGAQKAIMDLMPKAGYNGPEAIGAKTGLDGLSKRAFVNAATAGGGKIHIEQLKARAAEGGATHMPGAKWSLVNPWIQDAKFGSLDYSNEDAVTIDLTIRYDYATTS